MNRDKLEHALNDYYRLKGTGKGSVDQSIQVAELPRLVSRYYDAVTSLYEFGWGSSFHISPRRRGESFSKCQQRQERNVGQMLKLRPGMVVADIGCGVGGPLVSIASATGASIVGINFNKHQIRRGEERVRRKGLDGSCSFLYASFMDVPLQDETFDAMYSFDALCHAPDRVLAYRELFRLLKPGAEAVVMDWTLTDCFDPAIRLHVTTRDRLETNNATPDLTTASRYKAQVQEAGFEIIDAKEQQIDPDESLTPWYFALDGRELSVLSLARSPLGRGLTARVTQILEKVRLVPLGTSEAARILNIAADSLVEGGELGIFRPSYLVHARKPK